MDPAHGETGGKSLTSKLKAKVKGVKKVKNHLPGRKKREASNDNGNDSDSGSSSDDTPRKPGPETGYNLGASTPFTTVKTTPLSPERSSESRERASPRESHNRDYESKLSHDTTGYGAHHPSSGYRPNDSPKSMDPSLDEKFQYMNVGDRSVNYPNDHSYQTGQPYHPSSTEGMPKIGYNEHDHTDNKPSPGVLGHVKETVAGAAAAVGSKVGYYNEVDTTPVVQPPADPNAPSVLDKAKASLGMDKPRDPNAPTLMEKTKATLGMDKPQDPRAPTLMEKTKATLGMDKPKDPNAPTLMEKTKATLGLDKPSDPNAPSLLDKTKATLGLGPTSQTGEDVQHTFPAHSDYVQPAATVPRSGDREEERMPTSYTTDYTSANPMVNRY